MKKIALVLLVCSALGGTALPAAEVVWEEIGRGETDVSVVLVHPQNPRVIFMGNKHGVFKSEDAGKNWRNVLSVRGQNRTVNFLLFNAGDPNSIYAATGQGLFYSANSGRSWRRIFKGGDYLESDCTSVAVSAEAIYLGTQKGLFASSDKGRSWVKAMGKVGNKRIFAISYSPANCIYAASSDGVYKIEKGQDNWEKIFIARLSENGSDIEEDAGDSEQEGYSFDLSYIACSPLDLNSVYLATSRGVYASHNKGKDWEELSEYGLLSRSVRFILVSGNSLYAATERGIFEYKDERWHELSFGLTTDEVRFLAADNQGTLYAACDRGLFKGRNNNSSGYGYQERLTIYSDGEPSIGEVQKAAIKYAEVSPEKINFWRKQAAVKAILPKLSASVGRDTTDLWHWEGGSAAKLYDDVLIKGRDALDWDVTLSWDLSKLIWNPDQTSIDVRSKLMVQLRNDILDEVTKLYFERLRVKIELDELPIEAAKKRLQKELRLEELTASIDALTGGYFSKELRTNQA
ncbi:MAG: hypothetical protein QME65_02555 [Candidatus Omnitrophota bacterium]|nr:hypothetical protein [Candidatus Omnitrophota bacterium]